MHGQHPEQDRNVIGTRYNLFEAMKGQDRLAFQDAPGFSFLECQIENEMHARKTRLARMLVINLRRRSHVRARTSIRANVTAAL